MTKWIALPEKPPLDTGVLVTDGTWICTAQFSHGRFPGDADYWKSFGFTGYECEFEFDEAKITHWTLLPELPLESHQEKNDSGIYK